MSNNKGTVIQVMGPVLDIRFADDQLPKLNSAIEVPNGSNTIVAEVYPDKDYIEKNGITDIHSHLQKYVNEYNLRAVPYKKIGVLKVRENEFPKNNLRKIQRFQLDTNIE